MIKRIFVMTVALLCLVPVIITLSSSLMSRDELYLAAHIWPKNFSLRQFETVLLMNPQYMDWFWNSVKITGLVLLFGIPISMTAGYGFSKFEFPFKNALYFLYIAIMILPFQATLVPQYLTIKQLGLLNHQASVILPNIFGAFGAFLMTQYILAIDDELLEAGKIDGLDDTSVFWQIIVPLCKPAVTALAILIFIDTWSMIEQPLVFLTDANLLPLSLQLGSMVAGESANYAGGVVFMILPILIYLYGYDDLVEGISLSSIK